jgi:hypothetical protein
MNPARNSHTVCSRGKEYFNGARKIINAILILSQTRNGKVYPCGLKYLFYCNVS